MNRLFILLISVIIFAGCSGAQNPMLPGDESENLPAAVSLADGQSFRGDATLGIWEANVNLDNLELDYQMLRGMSAIGQTIPEALLNTYLTVTPCSTCMRMNIITFDPVTQRLTMSIEIRHPMDAFNGSNPISAKNRADLDVFDVMGIIILPKLDEFVGYFNYQIDGTLPIEVDPYTLTNADGYTHSMHDVVTNPLFLNPNYVEPISTLNPFKYYFNTPPERRFYQGAQFQAVDYVFDTRKLVSRQMRFYICFRASFGQAATFGKTIADPWGEGSRANPMYFLPEFNQIEAYNVQIEQTGELGWKNAASTEQVTVKCADHQAGKTGLGRYLFETDPRDAISFTSDVEKVVLDIPAISDTPFEQATRTSGIGTDVDPYVYQFEIQNNKAASFGTYPFFAIVEDTREFDGVDAFQIGALQISYIDNFDPFDNTLGWSVTTYNTSGIGWGLVDKGAPIGNVWDESGSGTGGSYGDEQTTRLNTPIIDFSYSSAYPYLEITHLYKTEFLWDGGSVFLSVDGGASFDYAAALPVIGGKGYDSVLPGSVIANTVLAGKWGFTGDSSGEVVTQFDLSKAAYHSNVIIQFVFESNYFTTGNGWEIRNIKIVP